ncbi:hypothetical protein AB1Y20_017502 [Prymnesium parvum]|uniref:Uncharacterized protein n=1 Tax=Prymnesium parvum TaxID=97485 RepID=A0AB34JLZ0_PRYPA
MALRAASSIFRTSASPAFRGRHTGSLFALGTPDFLQPCFRLLSASPFSQEQTDAAIREMNAEMEELFGGSMAGSAISGAGAMPHSPASVMGGRLPSQPPPFAHQLPGGPMAATMPDASPHAHAAAIDALTQKITWCTAELYSAQDIERCTKLATCIAECARAAAALK